jgi:hypothetical protein
VESGRIDRIGAPPACPVDRRTLWAAKVGDPTAGVQASRLAPGLGQSLQDMHEALGHGFANQLGVGSAQKLGDAGRHPERNGSAAARSVAVGR